jgi:hypothetical protein
VAEAVRARCGLAGWGMVRIPWAEIAQWRKNPGPAAGLTPGPHLKLVDEQTVLATAAILKAIQRGGWSPTSFQDWGVLAAPKYLGRARVAQAISRYHKQGGRSVSPLTIPTLSQHSVAGTVCLVLGSRGPNLGVSGGSTQVGEVLLNAMSLFAGHPCPGIWGVMTAWDPEPIPDGTGQIAKPTTGIGVALALVRQASAGEVRLVDCHADDQVSTGHATLDDLADFLARADSAPTWRFGIKGGGYLEIVPRPADPASTELRKAG